MSFLRAHGWDEGIPLQYAMVVHIVLPPTDDGEDCTGYQIVYRGGSAPDHVALGLFAIGKRYVEEGYRRRLLEDNE